jgi:hypothetical protein
LKQLSQELWEFHATKDSLDSIKWVAVIKSIFGNKESCRETVTARISWIDWMDTFFLRDFLVGLTSSYLAIGNTLKSYEEIT